MKKKTIAKFEKEVRDLRKQLLKFRKVNKVITEEAKKECDLAMKEIQSAEKLIDNYKEQDEQN